MGSTHLAVTKRMHGNLIIYAYNKMNEFVCDGTMLPWDRAMQFNMWSVCFRYNMIFLALTYILPMIAMAVSYTIIGKHQLFYFLWSYNIKHCLTKLFCFMWYVSDMFFILLLLQSVQSRNFCRFRQNEYPHCNRQGSRHVLNDKKIESITVWSKYYKNT